MTAVGEFREELLKFPKARLSQALRQLADGKRWRENARAFPGPFGRSWDLATIRDKLGHIGAID
jgi:hypothetical protein